MAGTIGDPTEIIQLRARLAAAEQAESRLREGEARLKAVLNAADLGAWHWNIHTGKVEMNPRYAEMLGYGLEEFEQRAETFFNLLHPDDTGRVQQALKDHFCGKVDNYSLEIRLRHKEGHWVWVLTSGRVIEFDDEGRPLIMTGTHQAISERVAERQALQESEARFRETFENAAVGMAHVSIEGRWLRVNKRLCEIVGYDREELLTKSFQEITYPDDLDADLNRFNAMMHGELPGYQLQKRYFTKAGKIVWVNVTASLQTDDEGEPLYRISVIEDISEQKRAEEALRRSEEQLAAALKGGNLGVFDYDPRTGRTEWDRTVRAIWGIPGEEPVSYQTFAAGVHPDDLVAVEEILDAALDPGSGRPFAAEFRVINRQSGDMRWVRAEGDVTFRNGTAVRLVGTVYDITQQKVAEEHRELLVNELNHRVKNTLAMVQGVAHQTFKKQAATGREAVKAFEQRIAALATAHTLLTRSNWEATTLNELACETLRGVCSPDAPVHIEGPRVVLKPKQAISFAMALHELCTNAVKYGALSAETGHVGLTWTLPEGCNRNRLKLVWRELGGPVVHPPGRRGFGSRMIEEALARELDGVVTMNFRPEGLECVIEGILEEPGDKS